MRRELWRLEASVRKSASGFSPRRESLRLPLPLALPWQAPVLQPERLRRGMISWRNDGAAAMVEEVAAARRAMRRRRGMSRER